MKYCSTIWAFPLPTILLYILVPVIKKICFDFVCHRKVGSTNQCVDIVLDDRQESTVFTASVLLSVSMYLSFENGDGAKSRQADHI